MPPEERQRRSRYLGWGVVVFIATLVARLALLQVVDASQYARAAHENRIRLMPIVAARGSIVDRRGRVLVTSRPVFELTYFNLGKTPPPGEVKLLARILSSTPAQLDATIRAARALPYEPIVLDSDLTPAQYSRVSTDLPELPNVTVQAAPITSYPLGDIGAQVFGYVGAVSASELKTLHDPRLTAQSIVGKTGLEAYYERYLQGTDGGREIEVDSLGQPRRVLGTIPPRPGDTLQLFMSRHLERLAYTALNYQIRHLRKTFGSAAPASDGAVIVMGARTGQVLAMVSTPSFNPNLFAQGITESQWLRYVNNPLDPLLNRAISAAYPPGSTYKMGVAISAWWAGTLTPTEEINCPAIFPHPPYPHNWVPYSLGLITLPQAIAQSCDTFFYEVGRRTGMDRIAQGVRRLGFGRPTGIDLPGEVSGFVPTVKYERSINGGAFYPGLNYITAIGQGADLDTLVQLVDYAALLGNRGTLYRPEMVKAILSPSGKVIRRFKPVVRARIHLPAAMWDAIHLGMHGATVYNFMGPPGGTAGAQFVGFPMEVAGKTGTAQQLHRASRAFFISFAPYHHPVLAVAVMIQGGGEGADVSPVARDIYDWYFHLQDPTNPFWKSHPALYGIHPAARKGTRHRGAKKVP